MRGYYKLRERLPESWKKVSVITSAGKKIKGYVDGAGIPREEKLHYPILNAVWVKEEQGEYLLGVEDPVNEWKEKKIKRQQGNKYTNNKREVDI